MERQWKLGEDMHQSDTILDPITFEQVITALHCNEKTLDIKAILKVAKEMLDSRLEDFLFLACQQRKRNYSRSGERKGIR